MHLIEYLFFTAFRSLLLLLPAPTARRLGRSLGRLGFRILSRRREVALDNLRHAFPDRTPGELDAIARGAFENFGISISEFLRFSRLDPADLRAMMNYDRNADAFRKIAGTKGLLFMTGHFGNWELTGAGSSCLAGVPYLVIVKTQSNRMVDRVVTGLRTRFGSSTVPMEKSVRETMATLGRGGVVALAGDQSAPRESDFVPFFGRDVATFRGPAAFALRARVPLMLGFTVRRPDFSYDFVVEEVDLADAGEDNIRELTRRHVAILEKYIRLHPDHWLWMHRRWKHLAPPGPGKAPADVTSG
jgi:KDO2-lipid IV(A) lauroyltransferase